MTTTDLTIASFFCPTTVHIGAGAARNLTNILEKFYATRVFIFVDDALKTAPFMRNIETDLKQASIHTSTFAGIEPDPSATTVHSAYQLAQAFSPHLLLAVGGGSTIDVAKAVGILLTNGGKIHDYEGTERFNTPALPLVAIPTTAGTGSEVSGSCVITDDQQNRKMSIRHASLNPARHAILDPEALTTLPAHVAAHAGMDAFVHALESYTSKQANLMTDALNMQALAVLSQNLRDFVADRSNLQAGLNMLIGSALTGMAFGQTGLGNVHCMARFIGAKLHLSHGLSNALCLPVVAQFNQSAATKKYAEVARIMQVASRNDPDDVAAQLAVKAITTLCRDVDIPGSLREVGAARESFTAMAADCAQAGYNRWNPRQTTEEDFLKLFEAAF